MDILIGTLVAFLWIPVIVVVLIIGFIFFKLRYKIAKPNQALVISGRKGKKGAPRGPVVLVSGGGIYLSIQET